MIDSLHCLRLGICPCGILITAPNSCSPRLAGGADADDERHAEAKQSAGIPLSARQRTVEKRKGRPAKAAAGESNIAETGTQQNRDYDSGGIEIANINSQRFITMIS